MKNKINSTLDNVAWRFGSAHVSFHRDTKTLGWWNAKIAWGQRFTCLAILREELSDMSAKAKRQIGKRIASAIARMNVPV